MRKVDGWFFPDHERHFITWMADPKNRMILNGRSAYQGAKQLMVLDAVPPGRRHTMVDIGAHIGTWSYNMSHWFKHVEAFEPVLDHRLCFVENLAYRENVTLHPYALGEQKKMVSITVDPTSTGGSFVKGHGKIQMLTLDSFGLADVDLIKADAEGYEEFIMRGAEETIKRWLPVICVEQKRTMARDHFDLPTMGAVILLKKWGYRTVAEKSGDYVMRWDDT